MLSIIYRLKHKKIIKDKGKRVNKLVIAYCSSSIKIPHVLKYVKKNFLGFHAFMCAKYYLEIKVYSCLCVYPRIFHLHVI